MPEISRFLGIIIRMFFNEHAPPHFHAYYGKYMVIINIKTLEHNGKFPRSELKTVKKWAKIHKDELLDNWELANKGIIPKPIKPL